MGLRAKLLASPLPPQPSSRTPLSKCGSGWAQGHTGWYTARPRYPAPELMDSGKNKHYLLPLQKKQKRRSKATCFNPSKTRSHDGKVPEISAPGSKLYLNLERPGRDPTHTRYISTAISRTCPTSKVDTLVQCMATPSARHQPHKCLLGVSVG